MVLRNSSTTHVTTIYLSSSECAQLPWFNVSTQAEHNGNISLELLLHGITALYSFVTGRTLHFISPPYPNSDGDSLHPRKSSVDIQGNCRTYKCMGRF